MDILDTSLSGPMLSALGLVVALGLVIRAFSGLARAVPDLRIRLNQIGRQLEATMTGIPVAKKTIKEIQETISPQRQQKQTLQDYYNTLMEIERKYAMAEQEKKDSEEIQLHRPGSGKH